MKRNQQESKIQRDVKTLLERFTIAVKMKRTYFPDYQFICAKGVVFFIEFKKPGKKPDPGQLMCHKELRSRGFIVLVHGGVKSPRDFYKEVRQWLLSGTALTLADLKER